MDTPYFQEEWSLPEGLILIGDDGHKWVALDYRYSRTSPIVYINSEEKTITTIAASFNEFLPNFTEPRDNKDTILKLTDSYFSDQNFIIKSMNW